VHLVVFIIRISGLHSTKRHSFHPKTRKLQRSYYSKASTNPWELVADPLRSADHTLGITALHKWYHMPFQSPHGVISEIPVQWD